MALLGAQLVITLVMVSVIQKIGPHYSLARWLLCSTGLTRYLYPTDSELRTLAGVPKQDKTRSKKGHKNNSYDNGSARAEKFHVPRNLEISLETSRVSYLDVMHLRFYTEYQWLVDFALYTALVYIFTEIYLFYFPLKDEINLSMMWCSLVIFFALKLLLSLTVQYFRGEESIGERSTCIVMGLAYLLLAMIVLIIDEGILELGLDSAYSSFNQSAAVFLEGQGLNSSGPASKLILKFFLALWCGVLGALFTFPGLRMARMHWDCLKYCNENKLLQILLNISFALPFLLVILWIRPVSRDYLTERIFFGMTQPLLTPRAFESMRLLAVVLAVILRLLLMPIYLQAYLNMAYHRVEDQKKEAGRITNVDLQKKIAAVFYYLCVVSVQYVAPILMCLYFALMYKTLGQFSWLGLLLDRLGDEKCPLESPTPIVASTITDSSETTITQSVIEFHYALESLKSIFTTDVFRGIFGFATWWSCFSWFATTSMGMVYQSYFTKL